MSHRSSAPPGIEKLFSRLKEEICDHMVGFLPGEIVHKEIAAFRARQKKAIEKRDNTTITVMGMRIDRYMELLGAKPLDDAGANKHVEKSHQEFSIRRVACEALVDEWNANTWIYSKQELIERTVALLSTRERIMQIQEEFTERSPNGDIVHQPSQLELANFIALTIAYLREQNIDD